MPATTELTKMILHEIKFTKKRKIIQHPLLFYDIYNNTAPIFRNV